MKLVVLVGLEVGDGDDGCDGELGLVVEQLVVCVVVVVEPLLALPCRWVDRDRCNSDAFQNSCVSMVRNPNHVLHLLW